MRQADRLRIPFEVVAEAPALVTGVDDVRSVGKTVDDAFGEPGVESGDLLRDRAHEGESPPVTAWAGLWNVIPLNRQSIWFVKAPGCAQPLLASERL